MFIVNEFYTRRQIHEELGGGLQDYLPTSKGRVVCACLTKELNPTLPYTILVGGSLRVKDRAAQLCSQREAMPVFLKESTNKWRYAGLFKVDKDSTLADDIVPYAKMSGRSNISRIIHLKAE